jgi:hypothetical protein
MVYGYPAVLTPSPVMSARVREPLSELSSEPSEDEATSLADRRELLERSGRVFDDDPVSDVEPETCPEKADEIDEESPSDYAPSDTPKRKPPRTRKRPRDSSSSDEEEDDNDDPEELPLSVADEQASVASVATTVKSRTTSSGSTTGKQVKTCHNPVCQVSDDVSKVVWRFLGSDGNRERPLCNGTFPWCNMRL